MLKIPRNFAVLAVLLLMVSLASACNEKAPTDTNECTDTSGETC